MTPKMSGITLRNQERKIESVRMTQQSLIETLSYYHYYHHYHYHLEKVG